MLLFALSHVPRRWHSAWYRSHLSARMDRYVKRARPAGNVAASSKRAKGGAASWGSQADPSSICVWNCSSLPGRIADPANREQLIAFVREHKPDVICFSEVRGAARALSPSAKRNDGGKRCRAEFKQEPGANGTSDGETVKSLMKQPEFQAYEAYFSLADWKYAGTGILVNRLKLAEPVSIRYSIDLDADPSEHDVNGRVICMEFATFHLLHTYCPNNGWAESHFKRRQDWDDTLKRFISNYRSSEKSLVWAGDLNVAPLDADLSHPSHYKRQVAKKPGEPAVASENVGQPGCTPAERRRFQEILAAGGLIDLYRHVHPAPAEDCKEKVDLFSAIFSWRGHRTGKHSGRGMRIDHFIGSEALSQRVEDVKILGHGGDRIGFMGSDHCPMILYLKEVVSSV